MEFEWEPIVFAIDDGVRPSWPCSSPRAMARSWEEAVYSVDGTYTYADGGETRSARLYFRNGELRQVFGFTAAGASGAPREIIAAARRPVYDPAAVDGPERAGPDRADGNQDGRHADLWRPDVRLEGPGRRRGAVHCRV